MDEQPSKSIDFHFIKSNYFRVVHCDGVWGGSTPLGYLVMNVYSERHPIPQKVTKEITSEGGLGEDVREGKQGLVREVEVELVLDLSMAKSLIAWLEKHTKNLEKILQKKDEANK